MEDILFSDYPSMVNSYLEYCKSNAMSKNTISSYERTLRLFDESMKRNSFKSPSTKAVTVWKIEMDNSKTKTSTSSYYLHILSNFFKWAVEMEYIDTNYCKPTVFPPKNIVSNEKNKPYDIEKILDVDSYKKIVNASCPKNVQPEQWVQTKAILVMLITTALRNDELASITPNDLDYENNRLVVRRGKGGKTRFVQFPNVAQECVKEFLRKGCRPKNIGNNKTLFGVLQGDGSWKKYNRTVLSALIERNIRFITGKSNIRSHALRHACASIMWDSGIPIDEISTLLGHKSITTTQIYASRLRPNVPSEHANNVFDNI